MFKSSKKIIISGAIGNALEMYDYIIWGLFSVFLSKEFLPPHSNLSDIFFLFLITYFLRPLGSLFGGMLADQAGRKRVLTLSIIMMGVCTALIGILPSYSQIGVVSVYLLLFIRLIQVFSVGSEYISSVSLLIESCEKNKKGYFGSWAAFGINAGMLMASLTGALVLFLIDMHILPPWGWRLAFILAFITMMFGFWIRNSIPESQEFISNHARSEQRSLFNILIDTFRQLKQQPFESFIVFALVMFGVGTTVLMFVYAPIHMTTVNNFSHTQAFVVNSVGLGVVTALVPLMGITSDLYGRTRIILMGTITLMLFIMPYFICLTTGSFSQIILFHCLMAIPCASIFAVTPVFITDIFPHSVRCSIANLIYSIAAVLGGGILPVIAIKLGQHHHYSPSYILMFIGTISLIALTLYVIKSNQNTNRLLLVE
ncbi:MFS transporter [Legionella israelensis]|uniref:Proline/betaine transporter ProP6 n=1 Tax=Legionella israelensis TaxID=454 RepID=A0A0W0V2K3_9GAMM|nr:MFS transporter [Legionella israelensis]KTD14347.1 proline/betaine transporter ProP6 [Legionella israelensis]QBS09773.1 MFS transporter [Legionella israelensis]SCY11591.1 MFS transporter, MHS family, proline/betaine transporter [Legionella israelensis DSM 19235]STX59321.1 putative proline/glycine betaine transporter [Legionella israelensis]